MDALEYWELIKSKKTSQQNDLKNYIFNFPNKVSGARMTGGITWNYTTGGGVDDYSKYEEIFTIDAGDIPELQRVNFAPQSIPYETFDEDIFYIYHTPSKPWDVNGVDNSSGLITSSHPIGTGTIKWYSRDDLGDPFVVYDTVNVNFHGQLTLVFYGGGNPTSGGRGADADEKRMTMDIRFEVLGTDAVTPSFVWYDLTFGGAIPTADSPFPWTDPWPGYTDIFTDSFNGYTDVPEFTGSCDLAFEWLY
jgi:hypothetical protein